MELDTLTVLSIIEEPTYCSLLNDVHRLEDTDITLCMYDGKELPVLAVINTCVQ